MLYFLFLLRIHSRYTPLSPLLTQILADFQIFCKIVKSNVTFLLTPYIYFCSAYAQQKYNAGNRQMILQSIIFLLHVHVPFSVGILSDFWQKKEIVTMNNHLLTPKKSRKIPIRALMEAITYRTPLPVTKVIVHTHGNAYPVCPRCTRSMEREYMSFCDRCGQRLSWALFDHAKIYRPDYKINRKNMSLFDFYETYIISDVSGRVHFGKDSIGKKNS